MKRLTRYVIVALLAVYSLLSLYAAASALWETQGTFGLLPDYGSTIRSVTPGGPAVLAGIVPGDRIQLAATPFGERRYLSGVTASVPLGTVVHFAVTHGETTRSVVLTAVPYRRTGADRSSLIIECIASVIFITVGSALILLRPAKATWGFGLYCLIVLPTASYPFAISSASGAFALICLYDVIQNVGVVGLLVFALDFPRPFDTPGRSRIRRSLPAAFVILAVMTLWPDVANLLLGRGAQTENRLLQVAFGAVFGLALYVLWDTQRRIIPDERERLRWVLIGFGVGLIANYVGTTIIFSTLLPVDPPGWLLNVFVSLNVLLPLTVAHAVIRHRVFEINFVVSSALVYTALTVALAAVFGLLDWFFDHTLADFRLSIVVDAGVSLGVAFAFDAVHQRTEHLVESVFFRKRRAAELRLQRLAEMLPEARSVCVVEKALIDEAVDALELTSAAVFRPAEGHVLARTAAHGWTEANCAFLDDSDLLVLALRAGDRRIDLSQLPWRRPDLPEGTLAPVIALRMHSRSAIGGIVLYGGHPSGTDIDPAEIEQLARIAHAAGIAFEEIETDRLREAAVAQTATIDALEARLDELRRNESVRVRADVSLNTGPSTVERSEGNNTGAIGTPTPSADPSRA